jgi:hypothetical protein
MANPTVGFRVRARLRDGTKRAKKAEAKEFRWRMVSGKFMSEQAARDYKELYRARNPDEDAEVVQR